MTNRNKDLFLVVIVILMGFFLACLIWVNYRYSSDKPIGNFFLPRWLGTQLFLMKGQSPYSEQTSLAIAETYQQRYGPGSEALLSFVYPFYSIFLFVPFALISDYHLALTAWLTLLEVGIIATALSTLSLCRWKLKPLGIIMMLVFATFWYHNIRPLINGDPTLLVSLFVSAALLALRANNDGLAGFLIALSMIKPQLIVLLVIFLLGWSISNKRWACIWSFIGSLALMIAFTSLLIPDWTWQNFRQVLIYLYKIHPINPGYVLAARIPGIGRQLGWVLTVFLSGSLIWEWRGVKNKDFQHFFWTACLTLAITQLIGLWTSIDNYSILFPGMLLVLATWYERWGKLGQWLSVIGALIMLLGLWALVINAARGGIQLDMDPIVFFFAPVLILVGLYWVRRWVINPPRMFFTVSE